MAGYWKMPCSVLTLFPRKLVLACQRHGWIDVLVLTIQWTDVWLQQGRQTSLWVQEHRAAYQPKHSGTAHSHPQMCMWGWILSHPADHGITPPTQLSYSKGRATKTVAHWTKQHKVLHLGPTERFSAFSLAEKGLPHKTCWASRANKPISVLLQLILCFASHASFGWLLKESDSSGGTGNTKGEPHR